MYDYKTPLDAVDQPRPKPRFGKAIAIKVVAVVGTLALAGMIGIVVATRCGKLSIAFGELEQITDSA